MAYKNTAHPRWNKYHKIVLISWYIWGLTKLYRDFICYYPECLVLQTRRHAHYGFLQLIKTLPVSFHRLTLDLIFALPISDPEMFNAIMSVIYKYLKRVILVPGKDTWSAEKWAQALFTFLKLIVQGLLAVLITDRDLKFFSTIWKVLFQKLRVELFYSIAYHPQTDILSKRTNQIVEITLQFLLHTMKDIRQWLRLLSKIQSLLNNAIFSSTGKLSNKVTYGFISHRPLDLLTILLTPNHF